MTVQTTYTQELARGISGQLADSGPHKIDSYVNEDAAEVRFGAAVAQGAADDGAILPADPADEIVGLVVHSHAFHKSEDLGDTGLKTGVCMSILRKGRILVTCRSGCAAGDRLFVRQDASGGGTEFLGAPENAEDVDGIDNTNQGRWMTSAAAGELAELEVDFTGSPTVL